MVRSGQPCQPPLSIPLTPRNLLCRARGASFRHFFYPRACCCVALLTEGNDNLLPFISQLVYLALHTTHFFSKHGWRLWIFGLLGHVVKLKPRHVLPTVS